MILKQSQNKNDIHDFEDFIFKYPVSEVCTMLLQILSEGSSSTYIHSVKIE
jgi:hypothetical protein